MSHKSPAHGKIHFFNRFYWPDESATAQLLVDLAESLATKGWRVDIVTSRLLYEGSSRESRLPAYSERAGVHIHRLWSTACGRGRLLGRLLDYLTIYVSFLVHLLTKTSPGDIVVMKTDPPLLSILGWICRRARSIKVIAWCQDVFPEVAEHALGSNAAMTPVYGVLKNLRNLSLNDCDLVAVLSGDMKQYLLATGIHSKIEILPNWAIQSPCKGDVSCSGLREEWGLSGRIVLGYSGNLGRAHDTDTFLKALPDLQALPNLTTLFIGGGAGYKQLKEQVQSYPESFCRFLPYQPREILAESLKVPDIHWFSLVPSMASHVYPSKFYGILQSGRPVIFIGDPCTELATMIIENGCGVVVAPGDWQGFAKAVTQMYADSQLRDNFGKMGKRLDLERTSRENQLIRWEAAIGRIHSANDL